MAEWFSGLDLLYQLVHELKGFKGPNNFEFNGPLFSHLLNFRTLTLILIFHIVAFYLCFIWVIFLELIFDYLPPNISNIFQQKSLVSKLKLYMCLNSNEICILFLNITG